MKEWEPSRTAMLAATARGAHLLAHGPRALVSDWLAWPLLGPDAEALLELGTAMLGAHAVEYATWQAARTRLPEDWLAGSTAEQYVILGAGLDSFAWRQTSAVAVHEFDHPATQGWKRARLEKLGVPLPVGLTMAETDFEKQSVADVIDASSINLDLPLFVSWLGVLPYLTTDAITAALSGLPSCRAAISYALPESSWNAATRDLAADMVTRFAEMGERLVTLTTPQDTAALLASGGFRVVSDIGADEVTARFGLPCVSHERIVLAEKGE